MMCKICIIKAKAKDDYVFNAYIKMGFDVIIPYRDYNIVFRLLRELANKCGLFKGFWINPEVKTIKNEIILIKDPLITAEYVRMICNLYPRKKVIVEYSNRVNRSTLKPFFDRPQNLVFLSYDRDDCEEYQMEWERPSFFELYSISEAQKRKPEYDIVYLGRDKGRADELINLEKKFNLMGLKTYFHICADRSFLRFQKAFYKPEMRYEDYIELLKGTRAHLNIVPNGQTSITQREMETIFNQVKCVTNNKGILDFELYDDSRFFVLGVDDINELEHFLESAFKPIPSELLNKYKFSGEKYLFL